MAAEFLKSQAITNADATPYVPNTAGQGAAGRPILITDVVGVTAAGIAAVGSAYRLCRIPTGAVIHRVDIGTDKALDTNGTPLLTLDVNLAFSDSTIDGTQAALQGLIPTTANTGATTSIASYSSPNKIFGAALNLGTHWSAQVQPTEITFQGSQSTYDLATLTQQPMWQTFGFVDGRGSPADPNGYFDLLVYVAAAAATGQAGNILGRVWYTI